MNSRREPPDHKKRLNSGVPFIALVVLPIAPVTFADAIEASHHLDAFDVLRLERPTPERVRAFIGTGTAEVIGGLLDAWWENVGSRILAQEVEHRRLRAVIAELEVELAELKGRPPR